MAYMVTGRYRVRPGQEGHFVAQMELLPDFVKRKKEIDAYYRTQLEGLADIRFQSVLPAVDPNCWLFTFRTKHQKALLKALNEKQLQSRPFWVPMNQLRMFQQDIYVQQADRSNEVYQECLSIPCSTNITKEEMDQVVTEIRRVLENA